MHREKGQILIAVLGILLFLMIVTPALVRWAMHDSESSVKWRKQTNALSMAQAGLDRGCWKLGSSTSTWNQALIGTAITGYNFDVTHTDVSGGEYRIRFSSGPTNGSQVTITAEGRDAQKKERRTVRAVYENQSLPGPVLAQGNINYNGYFDPHWGPMMAQGNITISGGALTKYYPRKFSKNTVSPRDSNGITPPNTDNLEWWSGYNVPDLPILDFTTMRSSSAANGTLNYYNVNASSTGHTLTGYSGGHYNNCRVPISGSTTGGAFADHRNHFYDSHDHPKSKQNLIWYYDGDLVLTGNPTSPANPCHRAGLYATLVVRGNLTIWTGDCYAPTLTVPTLAWKEYQKTDTSSSSQYPADTGLRSNSSTFNTNTQTWSGGPAAPGCDVGFRGFLYVGGNLTIQTGAVCDFAGAVWVVGNIQNLNSGDSSIVFYEPNNLQVPVLNVSLVQQSWQEASPSTTAWP